MTGSAAIAAIAEQIIALGESPARVARDPVNLPMIHNWAEALGDANPVYDSSGVAPPAMIQVWTMRGLRPSLDEFDPLGAMSTALAEAGYPSIVATNCEQTYHRYLRVGERVQVRSRLVSVVGPKKTALGEGYFVTTESTWYVGDEVVATMLFRVLRYRPGAPAPSTADVIRPAVSQDTAFFWQGTKAEQLRIQRCSSCGRLRHPPGPACPACGSLELSYVVSSGAGTIFSYVVHHAPAVPGRTPPFVVALVELDEGVRMVGQLLGADPGAVAIGERVSLSWEKIDDELTLPAWRLSRLCGSEAPPGAANPEDMRSSMDVMAGFAMVVDAGTEPPELRIEATPTFIVSSALATRDFQDVHHDRDRAVELGGKDIFVNILTSTGLVQRFVTDWAGPAAVVQSIAIRLGVPCYAYDTLVFTGRVTGRDGDVALVEVVGRNSLGSQVTGTVRVVLP